MKAGVLLVNSGTPASCSTRDVRRFLAGLLGDPRVVELPRIFWLPLLHGVILRVRPRASARKYRAIWTPQGSPLAVQSEALRAGLEQTLRCPVALGMLYGGGSTVSEALQTLRAAGVTRCVILPMFPQYSGVSTGAVHDQVSAALRELRRVPDLHLISSYHDHPAYIGALAASVAEHRSEHAGAHLLMSFHGVPERYVRDGDPYRNQCEHTASLLAARLGLGAGEWSVSFQSRFGADRWLQPYTSAVLSELPGRGVRNVDVICPGFAADCLETLEEIGIENRAVFQNAGGGEFHYIPALNARADHVAALAEVVNDQLHHWFDGNQAGRNVQPQVASCCG